MEKNYILLDKKIAKEFYEKAMKLPEYPHSYGLMKSKKIIGLCKKRMNITKETVIEENLVKIAPSDFFETYGMNSM